MTEKEFVAHVTDIYEVLPSPNDVFPKLEIQYSTEPNHEWYAIVNGVFVDVGGYDWEDFDGFIEACVKEYQKQKAR